MRQVRAPLDHVPLIATGGVEVGDLQDYLQAGAVAVGVATSLTGSALETGDVDDLRTRAAAMVAAAQLDGSRG